MTADPGRNARKRGNTHSLILGVQTDTATVEASVEVSPKLKTGLPKDTATPLLCVYPKGILISL